MRMIEVTRTNRGRYNGPMLIDADKLLAVQRVSDQLGTYTVLFTTVPDMHAEDGQTAGGFAGFDVRETPDEIRALLDGAPAPEPLSPAA